MNRRAFIAGLGSAAAWPLAARAQQTERARRVGVLMPYDESAAAVDLVVRRNLFAFTQRLSELGWAAGRNLRIDTRWAAGDVDRSRRFAKELVDLQPDVIFVDSTPQTAALQKETLTIPIVFAMVSDPVGSGFAASLPRPGGNLTGFTLLEGTMGGKWLDLLKEIAPGLRRAAAMFNPDTAPYVKSYYLPSFEAAARSIKVEPIVAPVRSDAEIAAVINSLGREPGGGLVIIADTFLYNHRTSITSLAAQSNLPSISWNFEFPREGGLLSYGADDADEYRRAASYVDRILRGANPADLPVQVPTKFKTVVNLKTAKALGLKVPPTLLALADEVIE